MRHAACLLLAAACGGSKPSPATTHTVTASPPAGGTLAPPSASPGPPVAAIHEVRETLYGIDIVDPYRWMEDVDGKDMQAFLRGQADYTRGRLDAVAGRAALRARLHELDNGSDRVYNVQRAGKRYFYYKVAAGQDNAKLYVRDGLAGAERLLVDPDAAQTAKDQHYALDWYQPSDDGAEVVYGISPGGSEDSTLHVVDAATGTVRADAIDRTQYAAVAWRPDGKSFFYWRRQQPGPDAKPEDTYRDSQTYLHVLGQDPEHEVPVIGHGVAGVEVDEQAFPGVTVVRGSKWAFGLVSKGVSPELRVYVAPLAKVVPGKTPWQELADFGDDVTGLDARGDDLYLVSHKGASRYQILHVKLGAKKIDLAKADVVVPASDRVVLGAVVASDALYVTQRDGAVGRVLRVVPGTPPVELKLPFDGTPTVGTNEDEPGARITLTSWTHSTALYAYDPKAATFTDTKLVPPSSVDFSDTESTEVEVKSADGTMVPLSIIHQKDVALDGSHPTLIDGYGAYGVSIDPYFDPRVHAWLEHGGVFALAHVRGGGEYGEDWHQGGREQTKQHTIDDFLACAQYLVDQKYTTPALLSGEGTSAGGILIGNAIAQRPELFGAALVRVGATNMTRFESTAGGPANVPEFGTVKTEAGFKALYAMDAYLHIKDGVKYPAVLVTTGAHDPRVPPWAPGKFAARLQKATASGKPVLLRVDYDAGHGLGSTRAQLEDDLADEWSFLLWAAGAADFQPR